MDAKDLTTVETTFNIKEYDAKTQLLEDALTNGDESAISEALKSIIEERKKFSESLKQQYASENLSDTIRIEMDRYINHTP